MPRKSKLSKIQEAAVPQYVPVKDAMTELRELIIQHIAITKAIVSIKNQSGEKKVKRPVLDAKGNPKHKRNGEVKMAMTKVPSRLPPDVAIGLRIMAERGTKENPGLDRHRNTLVKNMATVLKSIPLYTEFLSKVFTMGPVTAAYLCAFIRFDRCNKPSALRQYCGLGFDRLPTGFKSQRARKRIEGEEKARTLTYNKNLRTALYLWATAAFKNIYSKGSTKYLERWMDARHTAISSGLTTGAHAKGRRKATDLLLEDLYIMGRTLEGLPVWPSFYAAKLGYEHGQDGKLCINGPKQLTVAQAWEVIGNVGKLPPRVKDPKAIDDEDEDEVEDLDMGGEIEDDSEQIAAE